MSDKRGRNHEPVGLRSLSEYEGSKMQAYLQNYPALLASLSETSELLKQQQHDAVGHQFHGIPEFDSYEKVTTSAAQTLIQLAVKEYSPLGVLLEINLYDELDEIGIPHEPIDCDRLHSHLVNKYAGHAGHDQAYQQQAEYLASSIRSGSMETLQSFRQITVPIITLDITSEKEILATDSKIFALNEGSRAHLDKFFRALGCCMKYCSLPCERVFIDKTRHQSTSRAFTLDPEGQCLFDSPRMAVIFEKDKVMIRFQFDVWNQLDTYLKNHGAYKHP